jgi:hypothetical protein
MLLTDARLYVAQFDLSGRSNRIQIDAKTGTTNRGVFGATTKVNGVGLDESALSASGLMEFTTVTGVDVILHGLRRAVTTPITVSADGGDVGETAWFLRGISAQYTPIAGTHGDESPFTLSTVPSSAPLVRGVIGATGGKGSSASGAAYQLGAVLAAQKIYASLHVLTAAGTNPTLDVIVESDNAENFASPTTRLTFTQATGLASGWQALAGAITDDWWRVSWTVGGTNTPRFDLVVAIGIA